jgi:hypothetical protein
MLYICFYFIKNVIYLHKLHDLIAKKVQFLCNVIALLASKLVKKLIKTTINKEKNG